jgi:hypothetical protein
MELVGVRRRHGKGPVDLLASQEALCYLQLVSYICRHGRYMLTVWCCGNPREGYDLETLWIDERMLLKLVLRMWTERAWNGFIWLRAGVGWICFGQCGVGGEEVLL